MKEIAISTEKEKYQFCQQALEAKRDIEFRFIELGAYLHKIKEERLYEVGWESWDDFSIELKLPPSTISRLIRIYQIFVLRFNFAPAQIAEAGGWTVVAEFLPDISEETTKEEVKDWFGNAITMTRADLRRTIVEGRKGTDMAKCKHPNAYKILCCPDCGDREKIL